MIETGRSRMTIKQQVLLKSEHLENPSETLLCDGTIRIGWVDSLSLKPIRIPASILDSLKT
jgi:acyl-CoA thioester hydrolase